MGFNVATHVALSTAAHGHVTTQSVGSCQDVPPLAVTLVILLVLLVPISMILYVAWEGVSSAVRRRYYAWMQCRRQALIDKEFAEQDAFVSSRLGDEFHTMSRACQCKAIYEIVGGDRQMFLRQAMRIIHISKACACTYYVNIHRNW